MWVVCFGARKLSHRERRNVLSESLYVVKGFNSKFDKSCSGFLGHQIKLMISALTQTCVRRCYAMRLWIPAYDHRAPLQ